MANSAYKPTAAIRAGFEYQDLVGIETLIRFYRDPELFAWVKLEADDDAFGALDDVIAARADGAFEYIQAKFSVDGESYELDWDWLLERRPRGTSMLHKWSRSLADVRGRGPLHSAFLRTNRVPSSRFASALDGTRIDLAKLDKDTRTRVEAECGGASEAKLFFADFEFRSAAGDLDQLEAAIKQELVPSDLLPSGWQFFREQVRRWAMRKNEPPGGRILYQHLAQIITRQRPEPIRQDFRLPPGYALPNAAFNSDFLKRIASADNPITILWGTPGRGKSTYLSWLTEHLRSEDRPVLRHHYFLPGDETGDRASYAEISHSLISQLVDRYPEAAPTASDEVAALRNALTFASKHFASNGQRLSVVIDGLDHVWRDFRKVDQLNYLFNQLLPLPDNVSLIVGTQRVANSQLPVRLIDHATDGDWVEIPPMDEVAVHHWLRVQHEAGRLLLDEEARGSEVDALAEVSGAFYAISQGHPLHLIYAFESLTRTGAIIRKDDVMACPPCPDGDIRRYYAGLWNKLSQTARQILHALAGSEFNWPSLGIRQCLGPYEEIDFLLDARGSGIVPFHGSIFAFVKERVDHAESLQALLPKVVAWLEKEAPPYWHWGWLWLTKAKLGDHTSLMDGVSRDWAVDSLAAGWPERQVIKILRAAEEYAFRGIDFPRAVELRSIKTRVSNARNYQMQDFSLFEEVAITSSGNVQQLRNLFDDVHFLSDHEVAMLPRAAPASLRSEITSGCVLELGGRIAAWLELQHRPEGEFVTLAHLYLDLCALSEKPDIENVWAFMEYFKEPARHLRHFVDRLASALQYEGLLELREKIASELAGELGHLDGQILRVACALGADPLLRLPAARLVSPLEASWRALTRREPAAAVLPAVPPNLVKERYDYGIDVVLRDFVHTLFFATLAHVAATKDSLFSYPGLDLDSLGWLGEVLRVVQQAAVKVASGELTPDLAAPFVGTASVEPVYHGRRRATESDQAQYRSFIAGIREIANDLQTISSSISGFLVTTEVIERARKSPHWNAELWLERIVDQGRALMTSDAAELFLSEEAASFGETITTFNDRAEGWTLRARVASIQRVPMSAALTRRAADCLLGYGYRKDSWIGDVLHTVEIVHDASLSPAAEWLSRLVPIVEQFGEFTDGSGASHYRERLIEVTCTAYPEKLRVFFDHHVEEEEWGLADECLRQFVAILPLSSPEERALVQTYLDARVLHGLDDKAKRDATASDLLKGQLQFLGGMPTDHSERHYSSEPDEKDVAIEVADTFDFAIVVAQTSGIYRHKPLKVHFRKWLTMHKSRGQAKGALDAIRNYFASGVSSSNAEEVLDDAVQLSLETEGRERAYELLVRAHIARHGWTTNWTSREEVMDRLRFAAQHFPERWKEFILDTAEPQEFYRKLGYGLTIGTSYLAEYLLLVGQRDLAVRLTEAMVKTVVDEVSDQPISEASWFN